MKRKNKIFMASRNSSPPARTYTSIPVYKNCPQIVGKLWIRKQHENRDQGRGKTELQGKAGSGFERNGQNHSRDSQDFAYWYQHGSHLV
jgi:hypothetical protein